MIADIGQRAKVTTFLAIPERYPDSASWLDSNGLEDSHRFHHDYTASGIVSSTGTCVPGVKMSTKHHYLILEPVVGAW